MERRVRDASRRAVARREIAARVKEGVRVIRAERAGSGRSRRGAEAGQQHWSSRAPRYCTVVGGQDRRRSYG